MESTIGKRIAAHRRRLGLTQDQLAFQLGVTPQAVSKWENDQSCPDINTLPKLADLFGVTVDELLGRSTPREAEVVREAPGAAEGTHFKKGGWEFSWDSGRRSAVCFALFVLLVGGLMLVGELLHWDVSFGAILWPCAIAMFGVSGMLSRFSFFSLGCVLLGSYFLLNNLHVLHLDLGFKLVLPIILVLFGLSLLVDALRKKNKKPTVHINHTGHPEKESSKFHMDGTTFSCETTFGGEHHLIQLPLLTSGCAECSFGELTVDLSGVGALASPCNLSAECNFGKLVLLVPMRYQVDPTSGTAFGAFNVIGEAVNPVGMITLDAQVNFGEIQVRYI